MSKNDINKETNKGDLVVSNLTIRQKKTKTKTKNKKNNPELNSAKINGRRSVKLQNELDR